MPFAPGTTDNILKELIEEDEKVIYYIDKVNPRIHHLLINDKSQDKSAIIDSLLLATTAQLTTGELVSYQINRKVTNINAAVLDTQKFHSKHKVALSRF